jgi:Zn-dependent protease with chaperone function
MSLVVLGINIWLLRRYAAAISLPLDHQRLNIAANAARIIIIEMSFFHKRLMALISRICEKRADAAAGC